MFDRQRIRAEVVRHMREVSQWAESRGMPAVSAERLEVARKVELGASITVPQEREAIERLKVLAALLTEGARTYKYGSYQHAMDQEKRFNRHWRNR